jgi:hypothetical protein
MIEPPALWTNGLNDKEKAEFIAAYNGAQPVLKRLLHLIEYEVSIIEREKIDKKAYELASWPMYQADSIGSLRALKKIKGLIKVLDN